MKREEILIIDDSNKSAVVILKNYNVSKEIKVITETKDRTKYKYGFNSKKDQLSYVDKDRKNISINMKRKIRNW